MNFVKTSTDYNKLTTENCWVVVPEIHETGEVVGIGSHIIRKH